MHFVAGAGMVADNPVDAETNGSSFALYKHMAFYDGEAERVGQIVNFGQSENSYHVAAFGSDGKYRDFYVKWSVLFQRFESQTKY